MASLSGVTCRKLTELFCGSLSNTGCFYGLMSDTEVICGSLSDTGRFYWLLIDTGLPCGSLCDTRRFFMGNEQYRIALWVIERYMTFLWGL